VFIGFPCGVFTNEMEPIATSKQVQFLAYLYFCRFMRVVSLSRMFAIKAGTRNSDVEINVSLNRY